MKRTIILALVAATATSARADRFDERVVNAKGASASKVGKTYEASLYPFFGKAMTACIPPKAESPSNLGRFELIGSISGEGHLIDAQVRPRTRISECFQGKLSLYPLPSPPTPGHPIYVEMDVVP